jgi:type IV secretion system protein VirB9
MRPSLVALGLLAGVTAAHALEIPRPAGDDPHVRVAVHQPSQSVLLVGAVGRSMVITFGLGETITRVDFESPPNVDDKKIPAPWQAPGAKDVEQAPLGNILPLWAMREGRSSLQVVTQKDGRNRVYLFQLIALPRQPEECATDDCDDPRIITGLTFEYPADRRKADLQRQAANRQAAERKAAEARLKTDIFYGVRNWKYVVQGESQAIRDLAPNAVSDNSQVTGFRYLGNRAVPSIYIVASDGAERQVTPTPDQDLLVVYETAAHWRLRSGSEVIDLFNKGYDPVGANPETGTTSPEVIRVIRGASQ